MSKSADGQKRDFRFVVMLTSDEVKAIDRWRYDERIPTRAEAMRQLVQFGLAGVTPAAAPAASLRDMFAGQALAGMMANETTPFSSDVAETTPRLIAEAVYELADAMLAEREKAQP